MGPVGTAEMEPDQLVGGEDDESFAFDDEYEAAGGFSGFQSNEEFSTVPMHVDDEDETSNVSHLCICFPMFTYVLGSTHI